MRGLIVTSAEAGQRLDKFLNKYFNEAPRGFIFKMLRKKRIKLNGGRAGGNEILAEGDRLEFYISPDTQQSMMSERVIKPAGPVDVAYEDENILVISKPAGLLSHSESSADSDAADDTAIDRILYYLHQKGDFSAAADSAFTPALANRLDRNTSGLMLCGKSLAALQELNACIADGRLDKLYTAFVVGVTPDSGRLEGFHEKDGATNTVRIMSESSSSAGEKRVLTHYRRIAASGGYSLLSIRLLTGKSHQIRAHLASIGHPVAGDVKYGGRVPGVNRQLLHAGQIVFGKLTGKLNYLSGKTITAPWPDDLAAFAKGIGADIFESDNFSSRLRNKAVPTDAEYTQGSAADSRPSDY